MNLATDPLIQKLYFTAAIATGSGTVFAWTALRAVNGALSLRAEKLIGFLDIIALTYSRNESQSKDLEKKASTRELLVKWMEYNRIRSVILALGTVVGAVGLALDLK
jgi:hypothetical protein